MKTLITLLLLCSQASEVFGADSQEPLVGKWKYVSIRTSEGFAPIHEGDYVEFRDGEIRWRWRSTDYRHLYTLESTESQKRFVAFLPNSPTTPDIFAIFKIENGLLTICDRDASLGYPSEFSVSEGTLIVLEPNSKGATEQNAAGQPATRPETK